MASQASVDKARGKILQAGADIHAFNPDPQDLKQVASDAGYSGIEGKAFRTAITNLKKEGFLTRSKDIITWTPKGIATFPKAKDPPTPEERQAKFFETLCKNPEKLPGGLPSDDKFKIIFDLLLDGKSHTKKELAEATEYSIETKKFRNAMKRLEAVKMIDSATGKSIQMKEGLFGPGLSAAAAPAKYEGSEEPPKKKAKVDTNSAKKKSSKKKAAEVNKETSTSKKDDESNGDIDNENESEVSKMEDEDTPEEKESADEPSSNETKEEKNANEDDEDGVNDSDENYSASEGEGEESEWEEWTIKSFSTQYQHCLWEHAPLISFKVSPWLFFFPQWWHRRQLHNNNYNNNNSSTLSIPSANDTTNFSS